MITGSQLMQIMRNTLNKIDTRLIDHGDRVAYMVWKTACFDNSLNSVQIRDLTITSFLHDIGAFKTDEIDKMIEFETTDVLHHSIYGYLFLKYLAPLQHYSRIILCHHTPYNQLKKFAFEEEKWIQILSIADRFDVAMTIHNDIDYAKQRIYEQENTLFAREYIDLFYKANTQYDFINEIYKEKKKLSFDILTNTEHSEDEMRAYLDMISYSIDFRSKFMITHTMTANRISIKIADIMGLSNEDKEKIDLGSILHDLGKVAISIDILDYPGKLDEQKMLIMRGHVLYTEEILDHLLDDDIIQIAIRHHEKLNGTGYPKGLKASEIKTNERIVAIADILSALYEQRSYKGAFGKENIIDILTKGAMANEIDKHIVSLVIEHYDEIIEYVHKECDAMILTYKNMSKMYEYITNHYEDYLKNLM